MSASFEIIFELVPLETRLWKPETAPQAIVTKRIGKSGWFLTSKPTKAGSSIDGLMTMTPITPAAIMPIRRNIDR